MKISHTCSVISRALILVLGIISLSACDQVTLPVYWLCHGSSEQTVSDSSGITLETYQGKDPLMLEIWGSHIYQFVQGSFSGSYVVCNAQAKPSQLDFSLNSCASSPEPLRSGTLNLDTGKLLMKEVRQQGDHRIRNEGSYQCINKGQRFSFSEFNYG